MGSRQTQSAAFALLGGCFVVACLGVLAGQVFSRPSFLGLGPVPRTLLGNMVPPVILSLGTVAVVFVLWRRTPIRSLSVTGVGLISLCAGIMGRYVGVAAGSVMRGGGLPRPTALVTSADLLLGTDNPGLALILIVGILTAGLWSLVSAFAAIGVATLQGDTEHTGPE